MTDEKYSDPDEKECAHCGNSFPWPLRSGGTKKIARNDWFRRQYCSRACARAAKR